MPNYFRCEFRDNIEVCLNNCPYKNESECRDGQIIKQSPDQKKEYMKQYRISHKEQYKKHTENWIEKNPEKYHFMKRKTNRKRKLKDGKCKIQCEVIINGIKTTIFSGREHCFYFQNDEYFEIGFDELGRLRNEQKKQTCKFSQCVG